MMKRSNKEFTGTKSKAYGEFDKMVFANEPNLEGKCDGILNLDNIFSRGY